MPSLLDIRRRIRSVKNTQQITKAMKMVSAAKLRRAQERVIAARPYAAQLREMLASLTTATAGGDGADNPWLQLREPKRVDLIFFTSDTGLAGAFNSNLVKASAQFLAEHKDAQVSLILVGRKGRDFFRRRQATILAEHINLVNRPTITDAQAIANVVIDRYKSGQTDAVYLLNNEFKSVLSQKLNTMQLLPVNSADAADAGAAEYIYEQPPLEMLDRLMPRYVEVAVLRALLETAAAYHAARMTAMDAATTNAKKVIDTLTLNMNRIRQAAITKEIIEVVSGAAAAE